MGSTVQVTIVSQLLQLLPAALVRPLDAWSHRIAQRRALERQQKWLQRKAQAAGTAAQR